MEQDGFPTDPQVGRLMALLLSRFMWFDEALQASLDAHGWGGVRRLESMTMIHVHAGVRRPSDLARMLGVTRQSINTALRELEQKGLVRLVPDPSDKRCKIVEFAEEGDGMRHAAQDVLKALERALEKKLGKMALADLDRLLSAEWGEAPTVYPLAKREEKKRHDPYA